MNPKCFIDAWVIQVVLLLEIIVVMTVYSGLAVSVLSYGFWATFGAKGDLASRAGIDMAKTCLTVARDAGMKTT